MTWCEKCGKYYVPGIGYLIGPISARGPVPLSIHVADCPNCAPRQTSTESGTDRPSSPPAAATADQLALVHQRYLDRPQPRRQKGMK